MSDLREPSLTPVLPVSRGQALAFCALLAVFELLSYLASDMVMPAMLAVTRDLGAASHHVPTALNAYLLGGVAFQWLIGPLSDRFGRRPLLLAGTLLFSLACLAGAGSPHIAGFNALRFVQGIALGFVVVVSYPALQELFRERDAVRLMAVLANIALLSPLAGPLLGSLLLGVLSWRELFGALGLAGLLVAVGLWRWMPETLPGAQREPLHLAASLTRYLSLLRHRGFVCGGLALGLLTLPLVAWIGLSPLLLMRQLGLDALAYGLWQLPVFGGLVAGNLLLGRLLGHMTLERVFHVAWWPMATGLLMAGLAPPWAPELPVLVAGLAVYAFGLGLGTATLYRQTLYSVDGARGSTAAMLGTLHTAVLAAGGGVLAALDAGGSTVRFGMAVAPAALLAVPVLWLRSRCPPPQPAAAAA